MKIISPSYKRAGKIHALWKSFPTAVLVVPESQAQEYISLYGQARVIVCADKNDGAIARKRNWILDALINDDDVLMVDDDLESVWKFESPDGTTNRVADYHHKLNAGDIENLCLESFELARGFNTILWGVNTASGFWTYRASPISLTTVVLGPFMGICKGCPLRFDERMGSKEDYDFSLQVLRKYRKIVRWNKYHYFAAHGDNSGGLTAVRTQEKEWEWAQAIMRKWGTDIIQYKPSKKNILNGTVNCPIPGV